jgi:UDPglucose 6-dehydrogenase
MNIGIIGAGFVGLTFAAVLGSKNINTILLDSDLKKIKQIERGIIPFYEPKLGTLLQKSLKKSLKISTDLDYVVNQCEIIFVTVGTPTRSDGKINLKNIELVIKEISLSLSKSKNIPIIVIKSTVIPKTSETIRKILERNSKKKEGEGFGLVVNPEFLSEGKAVDDTLNPHIIVIGSNEKRSINKIKKFYNKLYKNKIPYFITNSQTAEMIKYANNSFLAAKISFINQLANICQTIPGTNIDDVANAIGIDPRIGNQFLKAGPGYGGSCLPKDLKALILFSKSIGQNPTLLEAVQKTNTEQIINLISLMKKILISLEGKKISILGLSFKENSDDIRESVSINLIKQLLKYKINIIAHDPMAIENTRNEMGNKISYAKSIPDALKGSECVIIMTPWKQYSKITNKDFELMKNKIIIDTRRLLTKKKLDGKYYAIGLGFR